MLQVPWLNGDQSLKAMSEKYIEKLYLRTEQTLSMHHSLRSSYSQRSLLMEIFLIFSSAIILAFTFSDPQTLGYLSSFIPEYRITVGVFSIFVFAISMSLLVLKWPSLAGEHGLATHIWGDVLEQFRALREEDGSWSKESEKHLSDLYWQASKRTIAIPPDKFNRLKSDYLLKVEVSKTISKNPGAPLWLIHLTVRFRNLRLKQ